MERISTVFNGNSRVLLSYLNQLGADSDKPSPDVFITKSKTTLVVSLHIKYVCFKRQLLCPCFMFVEMRIDSYSSMLKVLYDITQCVATR